MRLIQVRSIQPEALRWLSSHSREARLLLFASDPTDIQCLSNKLADSERGDKVPVDPVLKRTKSLSCKQLFAPEGTNHGGRPVTANVVVSPHEDRNGNDTDISHGLELLFGHLHLIFHHILALVLKLFQHIGVLGKLRLPELFLENLHALLGIPHEIPVDCVLLDKGCVTSGNSRHY